MSGVEILGDLTEDRQISWFQSSELRPGEEMVHLSTNPKLQC